MSLDWINQNKSLYKAFTSVTTSLDDYNTDINGEFFYKLTIQ